MRVTDKRVDSKVGKTMFVVVMVFLALTLLNKIWPGSSSVVGKLIGTAVAYGLFGFGLSMLIDWLLCRYFFKRTTAIVASCIGSLLLLLYLAGKQPINATLGEMLIGQVGTVIGLGLVLVIRLRSHNKNRAILEQLVRNRPAPEPKA